MKSKKKNTYFTLDHKLGIERRKKQKSENRIFGKRFYKKHSNFGEKFSTFCFFK